MKPDEIYRIPVDMFDSPYSCHNPYTSSHTLGEFLTSARPQWITQRIDAIRGLDKSSDMFRKLKCSLPCATLSSICDGIHDRDHVKQRNPVIVLDIDLADNPTIADRNVMDNLMLEVFNRQYVYAVSTSCSGRGFFAVVLLASNNDDTELHEYYNALEEDFANDYGLKLDSACTDVTRLRIVSTPAEYVKYATEVIPYSRKKSVFFDAPVLKPVKRKRSATVMDSVFYSKLVELIIFAGFTTDGYDEWRLMIRACKAFGDIGLEWADSISRNSSKYMGYDDVVKKWNQNNPYSIRSAKWFFNRIAEERLGLDWRSVVMDEIDV